MFIPGKSRTKVVPEGQRFQARYYDADLRLWFDLGDPRDTEAEARALVEEFNVERPEHTETPECIHKSDECSGPVEYRMALSPTGISYPHCDHHWSERLDLEQGLRERYPEHPPSDWSPLDAGEQWGEDD